jgi:hypothetical protein
MSKANAVAVTYLTNACGEDTGYGTLNLKNADYAKVAFEDGPGYVIPYIGQIKKAKYVIGNLEVAYQDDFWGDDGKDFDPEEVVKSYCEAACRYIGPRLPEGALLLPLDEGDPGRIIVQVAIPLKGLADSEATTNALAQAFGRFIELPALAEAA